MATVVLLLLAVGAFLALGMARAPMWAWAAAVGLLTLIATHGNFGLLTWIAWLPFLALMALGWWIGRPLRRGLFTKDGRSLADVLDELARELKRRNDKAAS